MFGRRYFAGRYFAPRYFPGGSSAAPANPTHLEGTIDARAQLAGSINARAQLAGDVRVN